MESANLQELYNDWQSAVQAHAELIRNGRMHGLTMAEIDAIGCAYVLRIDAAFARLKQAEARQPKAAAAVGYQINPASGEALSAS